MKNIGTVTFLALVLGISAGCQQERQKQTSGVSRKDRLVGYENLGLKDALAKCREEIENQKKLLAECQEKYQTQCEKNCQEQYKKQYQQEYTEKFEEQCDKKYRQEKQQYEENISWLLKDLPADLLKQVGDLTKENEELTKKVEELQKASKPAEPNQ
jgi:hypothetical protein